MTQNAEMPIGYVIAKQRISEEGYIVDEPEINTDHGLIPCDGRILTAVDYPELYAVIGTTFGGGADGFAIPDVEDFRGRLSTDASRWVPPDDDDPERREGVTPYTKPTAELTRVMNAYWCDEHLTIHLGFLSEWSLDHQAKLHNLYLDPAPMPLPQIDGPET